MKYFIYISLMALAACKGQQSVQVENMPDDRPAPFWVAERPISNAFYTGIGVASKNDASDFQEAAKKNALNDLASEISVNIEGSSLLYTLDRRYKFEEEFTSTIRATTSERLEGYEVVDSWSTDDQYWVYYRLDKSTHARLKAERKEKALALAKDRFSDAELALSNGGIREAFSGYVRALLALKEYWNENDRTMLDGQEVFLGNHIHNRLQEIAAGIEMNPLPEFAKLELKNEFSADVRLMPEFVKGSEAIGLKQLPLIIEVPRTDFVHRQRKSTGQDGLVYFEVKDVAVDGKQEACITVDLKELVGDEMRDPMVRPLLQTLTAVTHRMPIDMVLPSVYMEEEERNLGHPLQMPGVASVVKQELTKRGFRFTTKAKADVFLLLKANTRKGNVMKDFHTVYLDLEVMFERADNGDIIHHTADNNIKGVQLNWRKAGEAAYKKGGEELKKRIVPAMIDSLL